MIEALRTPEDRFSDLPDFPYAPAYIDDLPGADGLRMAYVDEGPRGAPVALCLHGEPTWSYLYRKMIPPLVAAGYRVVAPDLIGFGRSDKPVSKDAHSFSFHRDTLLALIERLDLRDITLVVQDWGGVLGLTLPMADEARYSRLLIMNTALPLEPGVSRLSADVFGDADPQTGFGKWRALAASMTAMPVGKIVQRGAMGQLSAAEVAAYDAPFPDEAYQAGALVFPLLVPLNDAMDGYAISQDAAAFWGHWDKPAFMAIGPEDDVIPPKAMARMRDVINGCSAPHEIEGAGHFVQERGEEVVAAALAYFGGPGA